MNRVLLVDDEEAILRLLETILVMNGFEVSAAASARAALQMLKSNEFNVVMTDLRMETALAGYDVARAADQLNPRPLIVLLTASEPHTSDWRISGADALLEKGTGTLEIPNQLRALLRAHNHRRKSVA